MRRMSRRSAPMDETVASAIVRPVRVFGGVEEIADELLLLFELEAGSEAVSVKSVTVRDVLDVVDGKAVPSV